MKDAVYTIKIKNIQPNPAAGGARDKIITAEFAGRTYTIQYATNKSAKKLEKNEEFKKNITQLIQLTQAIKDTIHLDPANVSVEINTEGKVTLKHKHSTAQFDETSIANCKIKFKKSNIPSDKKVTFSLDEKVEDKKVKINEKKEVKTHVQPSIVDKSESESISEPISEIEDNVRFNKKDIAEIDELIDAYNDLGESFRIGLRDNIMRLIEDALPTISDTKKALEKEINNTKPPSEELLLEYKNLQELLKKILVFITAEKIKHKKVFEF